MFKSYLKVIRYSSAILCIFVITLHFINGKNGFIGLFKLITSLDIQVYSAVLVLIHSPFLFYGIYRLFRFLFSFHRYKTISIIALLPILFFGNQLWQKAYSDSIFKKLDENYKPVNADYVGGTDYKDYRWKSLVSIDCGIIEYEEVSFPTDSTALIKTRGFHASNFVHVIDFLGLIHPEESAYEYKIKQDTLYFYDDTTFDRRTIVKRNFRFENNELIVEPGRFYELK